MAWGVSFNVGLAFVPHPDWTVGLTYQHGADLVFEGDAALDMNHDFFTTDLAFKGLAYPAIVKGKAFIEFPFPASLRLGVGWQVSEAAALEVMASWVRWSVLKALNVTIESQDLAQPELGLGPVTKISLPRDALDTVEVEAVFGYQLDTDVRLGLRAGYHSPFSPDDTLDMASVDGHRVLGAVMADYKVSDAITLSGHVAFQFMLPREVVSSRHDRANGTYDLFILNAGGALSFSL
jgi:long-chain fatty acid transport protein